jgi:hypothetical protein
MFIVKEAIYGNMATVFHRTSVSDLVNKVFEGKMLKSLLL